jgi:hypothetical protein
LPSSLSSNILQPSILYTPQSVPVTPQIQPINNNYNPMTTPIIPQTQYNSITSPPSSATSSSSLSSSAQIANINAVYPNETFEQKWARIQAAKKTNPFAEDIAKKFEIKLT